jgi:hypothetical protein
MVIESFHWFMRRDFEDRRKKSTTDFLLRSLRNTEPKI